MKPAICVSELRKSYGTNQVLKGVSFDILPGEIFGILGVNGVFVLCNLNLCGVAGVVYKYLRRMAPEKQRCWNV